MSVSKIFIYRDSHVLILASLIKNKIIDISSNVNIYVEDNKISESSKSFLTDLSSKKVFYFTNYKWSNISPFLYLIIGLFKLFLTYFYRREITTLTFHDMNHYFLYYGYLSNYILIEEGNGFKWARFNHKIYSFSFFLSKLYSGKLADTILRTTKENTSSRELFLGNWDCVLKDGFSHFEVLNKKYTLPPNIDFIWLHQCPTNCCTINSQLIDVFFNMSLKPLIKLHPSSCDYCIELFNNSGLDIWTFSSMPIECFVINKPVFSFFSTYSNSSVLADNYYLGDTILISTSELLSITKRTIYEYFRTNLS
jgi:hypothetical protein